MTYREEQAARLRKQIETETYEKDGALRWKANDAVLMVDTFKEAGIEPPAGQAAARAADLDGFFAEYRKNQPAEPGAEERFEALAAHGPGVELVDVISGRRFTT